MKKGGYQILDLNGLELTGQESGVLLNGTYAVFTNSHGKPILISGIVIDGEKQNDVFVTPLCDEDGFYHFELYGYKVDVEDDNVWYIKSKIIELETPYTILGTDVIDEYTGSNGTLYLSAIPVSVLGVDNGNQIKRIYSSTQSGFVNVLESNESTIYLLSYRLADGETIDKVELY